MLQIKCWGNRKESTQLINCSNTTRHPGDVKITSDETGRNTIKYHVKFKRKEIKMNELPKIQQIVIEMLSLTMTIGNPFIKDRATEFASLQSFNEWMEDVSKQDDYEQYFPKIVKIGTKLLIVTSPCEIV